MSQFGGAWIVWSSSVYQLSIAFGLRNPTYTVAGRLGVLTTLFVKPCLYDFVRVAHVFFVVLGVPGHFADPIRLPGL